MTVASRTPDISVVIPSYRGIDRLPRLLDRLEEVAERRFRHDLFVEVLIVDDGSPREEQRALQEHLRGRGSGAVRFLSLCLPENRGQQYATIAGVNVAAGELVATIDDDGGHPPEQLCEMVERMIAEPQWDLIYGAASNTVAVTSGGGRARRKDRARRPLLRRLGTALNNLLFRLFAGKPIDVPVTSFRVIRRTLVNRALALPVSYAYLSAMLFACRPAVTVHRYPAPPGVGESRYSLLRLTAIFWNLLLFWGPLRPVGRLVRPQKRLVLPRGCD